MLYRLLHEWLALCNWKGYQGWLPKKKSFLWSQRPICMHRNVIWFNLLLNSNMWRAMISLQKLSLWKAAHQDIGFYMALIPQMRLLKFYFLVIYTDTILRSYRLPCIDYTWHCVANWQLIPIMMRKYNVNSGLSSWAIQPSLLLL